MDITLDPAKISSLDAMATAALAGEKIAPQSETPPLLGSNGVTVTEAETSDIAKLTALLLNETNVMRERTTRSRLGSLVEVFRSLNAQARETTDKLVKTSDDLNTAQFTYEGQEQQLNADTANLDAAKKAVADAKTNLDIASKNESDAAAELKEAKNALAKQPGESDEDYQRRLPAAERRERQAQIEYDIAKPALEAAQKALAESQNKVDDLKQVVENDEAALDKTETEIDRLSNEVLDLVDSLDLNTRSNLSAALRLTLNELENIDPLAEEDERDVGNLPLEERSVLSIIRDSLRAQAGDFRDTLETRREELI